MKTIIIDDRKERKHQYLDDETSKQLYSMCDIREELPSFLELGNYDLLAIHESLLKEKNQYEEIVKLAKENKKWLVLFSGGITQNYILNDGRFLKINSSDFYSRITTFLEKYSTSESNHLLLHFIYGEEWNLPLLLKYKNLIWIYGEEIESIESDDYYLEKNIREILSPGTNVLSMEWIEGELQKYREGIQ